jgi:hypothetical protein
MYIGLTTALVIGPALGVGIFTAGREYAARQAEHQTEPTPPLTPGQRWDRRKDLWWEVVFAGVNSAVVTAVLICVAGGIVAGLVLGGGELGLW